MLPMTLSRGFAAAVLLTAAASAADACSRPSVPGSDVRLDAGSLNVALADKTILAELNYHRCKAGLSALAASANLRHVAETHAKWMARTSKVSHQSSVSGQSSLRARLSSSGVKFHAGSENIAMVHRFRIDGTRFRVQDSSACSFATNGGQPIASHSYASLARHAVNLWMASSGHRRNILDRQVTMVGSAAALNPGAPYCGQVFLSQNFAG